MPAGGGVEAALRGHIEAMANDNQDMIDAGPLESVTCRPLGEEEYRGEPVFYCEAEHRSVIADWCAALVDGDLYTHNSASDLPCVQRSAPASPAVVGTTSESEPP